MPNYRRNYVPGGTFFFTVVTARRNPLFVRADARRFLRTAFTSTMRRYPFTLLAIVLLPDHLHTVWRLPTGDTGYSIRWAKIKGSFTKSMTLAANPNAMFVRRASRRERAVWQPRFWEHTCRDEDDLARCIDYIHWNPAKHGLVRRVADYPYSTFHRFVQLGEYDLGWGSSDPCPEYDTPEN